MPLRLMLQRQIFPVDSGGGAENRGWLDALSRWARAMRGLMTPIWHVE